MPGTLKNSQFKLISDFELVREGGREEEGGKGGRGGNSEREERAKEKREGSMTTSHMIGKIQIPELRKVAPRRHEK